MNINETFFIKYSRKAGDTVLLHRFKLLQKPQIVFKKQA